MQLILLVNEAFGKMLYVTIYILKRLLRTLSSNIKLLLMMIVYNKIVTKLQLNFIHVV